MLNFRWNIIQGTATDDDYLDFMSYIWRNHGGLDLLSLYHEIKDYEDRYGMTSEKLYHDWRCGLPIKNAQVHDWLIKYMSIREFINEKES